MRIVLFDEGQRAVQRLAARLAGGRIGAWTICPEGLFPGPGRERAQAMRKRGAILPRGFWSLNSGHGFRGGRLTAADSLPGDAECRVVPPAAAHGEEELRGVEIALRLGADIAQPARARSRRSASSTWRSADVAGFIGFPREGERGLGGLERARSARPGDRRRFGARRARRPPGRRSAARSAGNSRRTP